MKVVALIPARLEASRFPQKLIQDLSGLPVIYRTVENAIHSGLFHEVVVVADHSIFSEILAPLNIKVHLTQQYFECGSDRIASVADQYLDYDIIVNIQGDEPFINEAGLRSLIELFDENQIEVASLVHSISKDEVTNPNFVKVALNQHFQALLFSRSVIPYHRNPSQNVQYYRHVGIYAFTPPTLQKFSQWKLGQLEQIEQIEALRFIENGMYIQMVEIFETTIGIDTPEDLQKANALFKQ